MVPQREPELLGEKMEEPVLGKAGNACELTRVYPPGEVRLDEFENIEQPFVGCRSISFHSCNPVEKKFTDPEDLRAIKIRCGQSVEETVKRREVEVVEFENVQAEMGILLEMNTPSPLCHEVDGNMSSAEVPQLMGDAGRHDNRIPPAPRIGVCAEGERVLEGELPAAQIHRHKTLEVVLSL